MKIIAYTDEGKKLEEVEIENGTVLINSGLISRVIQDKSPVRDIVLKNLWWHLTHLGWKSMAKAFKS